MTFLGGVNFQVEKNTKNYYLEVLQKKVFGRTFNHKAIIITNFILNYFSNFWGYQGLPFNGKSYYYCSIISFFCHVISKAQQPISMKLAGHTKTKFVYSDSDIKDLMILLGHDFSYKSNKDNIYSGSSKLQRPLISPSAWEQNKKYYFLIY